MTAAAHIALLPHHRFITPAEAATCETEFQRRWNEWLEANRDKPEMQICAHDVHKAIWQGAHGAQSISVREDAPSKS
jgi:hypothetical protein